MNTTRLATVVLAFGLLLAVRSVAQGEPPTAAPFPSQPMPYSDYYGASQDAAPAASVDKAAPPAASTEVEKKAGDAKRRRPLTRKKNPRNLTA